MADTSGKRLFKWDFFPRRVALYVLYKLDDNETFTCDGFDPDEALEQCFIVNTEDASEIGYDALSSNVVQIDESGLDDVRALMLVVGLIAPR